MSFSGSVKQELVRQLPSARHCQIAELAALFDLNGRIRRGRNGNEYLEIRTENLTVARKSYMLLNSVFHNPVEVRVRCHNIHGSIREYYIEVTERHAIISILKALKMMDEQGGITGDCLGHQHRLIQNTCCKRAFLRGAFLAAGSFDFVLLRARRGPKRSASVLVLVENQIVARCLVKNSPGMMCRI